MQSLAYLQHQTRRRAQRAGYVAAERSRWDGIVLELIGSGLVTGLGAVGVVGGIAMSFATCREGSAVLWSPCAGFDVGFVIAGSVLATVGLLALIIGAIWLGSADERRRRTRTRLMVTSLSVAPNHGGATLQLGGRF